MENNRFKSDEQSFLRLSQQREQSKRLKALFDNAAGEEEISLRDENVKHFNLGANRHQAVVYSEPVHFRNSESDAWQEIDNTLEETVTAQGISLPIEGAERVSEDERMEAGRKIQESIYGTEIRDEFASLPEPFNREVPDILTGWYFGDFCTRGVLDAKTRELLSLVLLAALGAEKQLGAHVSGCLKAGATQEEIYTVLLHALPYMGFPLGVNAIRIARQRLEAPGDAR